MQSRFTTFTLAIALALVTANVRPLTAQSPGLQSPGTEPKPAASSSAPLEFPVTWRQNIVAGKTPVATKVEAKLTIATLVNKAVVPAGAIFAGEVIESTPKSTTAPSRLAVRIDSVQWRNGSKPVKLFLTAWYYPLRLPQDMDMTGPESIMRTHNTESFPGSRIPPDALPPPTAQVSDKRSLMKDVELTHNADGVITLTSQRSSIKLNKSTIYVLATSDLTPAK